MLKGSALPVDVWEGKNKDFNANWRLGRGEFREFRELVLIGVDFVSGRRVFVWGA